jgi:hypothetical protein
MGILMTKEFIYFVIDNTYQYDYSHLYLGDVLLLLRKILTGWKLRFTVAKASGIERYYIRITGEKNSRKNRRNEIGD